MENVKEYLYFIYLPKVDKYYIGETIDIKRINLYINIKSEKLKCNPKKDWRNHTKAYNNINEDLINDIWYKDIDYIFKYFLVTNRKELEVKYIRQFIKNNKSLYNKKLYKNKI